MKFIVLIYNDPAQLGAMPAEQFATEMRGCLAKADAMRTDGTLLDSQMLEDVSTARTLRARDGRPTTIDGPFAEAKEVLGGFNLIEAEDMDEALRIAATFPWWRYGSIEVRPVRDIEGVRANVGG